MPLFEFSLFSLEKVMTWGKPPTVYLHWFGLTDGIYHLSVGDQKLFQYSEEILSYWKRQNADFNDDCSFVDYQLVRLHEDLLEMLPDILQEVPADVAQWVDTPQAEQQYQSLIDADDSDHLLDDSVALPPGRWWAYRKLDTAHLNQGPDIRFWRVGNTVHIRWNNQDRIINGIPVWSALSGRHSMTLAAFIEEVRSFDRRLMDTMAARIDILRRHNPIPHVQIDMPSLIKEHYEYRSELLESVLSRASERARHIDWEAERRFGKT